MAGWLQSKIIIQARGKKNEVTRDLGQYTDKLKKHMVVAPYQVGFNSKPNGTLTEFHLTCWQCANAS